MGRGKQLTPYHEQLIKAKLGTICVEYDSLQVEEQKSKQGGGALALNSCFVHGANWSCFVAFCMGRIGIVLSALARRYHL